MKTFFVAMMVAMMLWNGANVMLPAQKEIQSTFYYQGREYTMEELGAPSVSEIKPVRGWYINGYHLIPKEVKHKGAVIVFGGGEGSCGLGSALLLANEGYEVYSMYFFGQENQRKQSDRVPLEFFAELYLHIQQTARSPKPLTIEGGSKGAELALLLASYYPEYVDHLILFAPLSHVFEGPELWNHSPWTFQGKELPFIHTDMKEGMNLLMLDLRNRRSRRAIETYQHGLKHDENRDKARIDLAPVRAKMLIFAGEMDAVIPAADMGREIKANYKGECELVIFEKAGHAFSQNTAFRGWELGGDPEANVQAAIESNRIRLEKLAEWTK